MAKFDLIMAADLDPATRQFAIHHGDASDVWINAVRKSPMQKMRYGASADMMQVTRQAVMFAFSVSARLRARISIRLALPWPCAAQKSSELYRYVGRLAVRKRINVALTYQDPNAATPHAYGQSGITGKTNNVYAAAWGILNRGGPIPTLTPAICD